MATFKMEIVSPDGHVPVVEVESVSAPARRGRLAVLAGHQPMICELEEGILRVTMSDGSTASWQTGWGVLRVSRSMVSAIVDRISEVPLPSK